jgi:hypothetical protein
LAAEASEAEAMTREESEENNIVTRAESYRKIVTRKTVADEKSKKAVYKNFAREA